MLILDYSVELKIAKISNNIAQCLQTSVCLIIRYLFTEMRFVSNSKIYYLNFVYRSFANMHDINLSTILDM